MGVESRLASLEATYGSFPVNQTTLSVSTSTYERSRERCEGGLVDIYVAVYNEVENVLFVRDEGAWELPHASPATEERLEERARQEIHDLVGVSCSITGVDRVTILGLVDEADRDRDPVYRLITLVSGRRVDGSVSETGEWRTALPESALPAY